MSSILPPQHTPGKTTTDDWVSPKFLAERLGPFDLDPCASASQPWKFGEIEYRAKGLELSWGKAFVWMNPPYGKSTGLWLAKLANHNNGIALIFARTETKMFFDHVWPKASALLFLRGRLTFCYPDGTEASANSGGPSVLIAYGTKALQRLKAAKDLGAFVKLA